MTQATSQPAVWFLAIRAGSGADVFTERLVEQLQQRGFRADITWLPHRTEYAPWTAAKPKPPAWANIAHVNTWLPKRFLPTSLPIIATLHGCIHDPAFTPYKGRAQALYHKHWIHGLEAKILCIANQVVAVSHYTARQASAVFGRNDIPVIPNAIDLSGPFHPIERASPHQPFRLLYVGNWSPRKGVDLLAPIMENLGAGFELHYTTDRKNSHERYGDPTNSRRLGRFSNASQLASVYQEADALLFPSRLEGLPLTVLEAQACGLPVIAARSSSLPEVITVDTGFLCIQDDSKCFANAARQLAQDNELWQRMRLAARKRIEERFSLDAMIDSYIELYRNVLSMRQGGNFPQRKTSF